MTEHFLLTAAFFIIIIIIIIVIIIIIIYRWQKMFYIALDKANWSQPKIEKLYIYIKA